MTSAVYDVAYMGSVALKSSAVTSRLGTLQRSLLDLYVTYMPASSKSSSAVLVRQLPQRRLTLTDRGIIVSAIDAVPPARADNDAFYAMPSVVFSEAVRFAAVRAGSKYRGAFEPIGEDLNAARDNMYVALDKHSVHLVTKVKQHPVMVICVFRRSTKQKTQHDLHAFVCDSPQHAVDIVDDLQLLQSRYNDDAQGLDVASSLGGSRSDISYQADDPLSELGRRRQDAVYRDRQQQQQQQQPYLRGADEDLSRSCFVLTQDDVRGDAPAGGRQIAAKPRRQTVADDRAQATSGSVGGRSALARSVTSVTPADSRQKSLMPVFAVADSAAVASTWLDTPQQSDYFDQRSADCSKPAGFQSDNYDFHFALGSSSAPPATSSQQPPVTSSKPVALVQPHKVTGVRVMPDELNVSLVSKSQSKQPKPLPVIAQSPQVADPPQQQADRPKINKVERRATTASSLRDLQLRPAATPPPVSKHYNAKSTTASQDGPSSSAVAVAQGIVDQPDSTGAPLSSKDKEIASAIGNMRLDYESSQNTLSAHGTNFEKCLGYFP